MGFESYMSRDTTDVYQVVCSTTASATYTGILYAHETFYCESGLPYVLAPQYKPKKNLATSIRFRLTSSVMLVLMCLMGTVMGNTVLLNELGVEVVDSIQALSDLDNIEGKSFYLNDNKTIVEVTEVSGSNLTKRVIGNTCPSRTINFKQYQLVNHGYWWSSWTQATSTNWCGQGGGGDINKEISWTIGTGISVDVGISITKVIELLAGVGVSVERSVTRGCSVGCACSTSNHDYLKACVWEQSRLAWSDTQVQNCYRYENCDGGFVQCDAWSPYQRTNQPFKNAECSTDYQYGCSHDDGCL